MLEWEPLVHLLELLGENPALKSFVQIVSIIVILTGLYRYALKPSWRFHWKLFDAAEKVLKAYPIIMQMAADFQPNGGNSLRDIICRIDKRQDLSDSRMRAFLHTAMNPLFETDDSGNVIWVNRAWVEKTGFTVEESIGFGWLNIICQDFQISITKQWRLAIEQRRDCTLEFDLVTRRQEVKSACIEATIMKSGSHFMGYVGRLNIYKENKEHHD